MTKMNAKEGQKVRKAFFQLSGKIVISTSTKNENKYFKKPGLQPEIAQT